MKQDMAKENKWRWWCGGGVIGVAVVLGCASAVQFKEGARDSKAEPVAELSKGKIKRGIAAEPGQEPPHNGGKMRMPVSASIGGDGTLSVARDPNSTIVVAVAIAADADIKSIQGVIEGTGGLQGVSQPVAFTELASGETQTVGVTISARSGSLLVRITGDVGGISMSSVTELKITNSRDATVSTKTLGPSAATPAYDMSSPSSRDATGQVVQPMTSGR